MDQYVATAPEHWDHSILDGQADVKTQWTAFVTIEDRNGWDDIDTVKILCWYDGGDDANLYGNVAGDNYNFMLWYDNTGAPEAVPTIDNMHVALSTDGLTPNTQITLPSFKVFEVIANQKYNLTWNFTPDYQMKQADLPGAVDGSAYANANSWNVKIEAADAVVTIPQLYNETGNGDAYEFGVCKYTSVSTGGVWSAVSVAPNLAANTNIVAVTTRSNDDFDLTVWMVGDLALGVLDTILTSGSNVKILKDASVVDDIIASDLTFTANGVGGEKTILSDTGFGKHSTYMAGNNQLTTDVEFNIHVPYGTLPGSYTAGLTFTVTQV
jgi:hypothetical protein